MANILEKKGQMAGYEFIVIMLLFAYAGYMTYLWGTKQTETKVFKKGSTDRSLESSPHFGCTTVRYEEYLYGKINPIVNGVKP